MKIDFWTLKGFCGSWLREFFSSKFGSGEVRVLGAPRNFLRKGLNVKSRAQWGQNFEKIVFLSSKKLVSRSLGFKFKKFWKMVFLSLKNQIVKFYYEIGALSVIWDQAQCKCNNLLNFFTLKGGGAIAHLAPPLGTQPVRVPKTTPSLRYWLRKGSFCTK